MNVLHLRSMCSQAAKSAALGAGATSLPDMLDGGDTLGRLLGWESAFEGCLEVAERLLLSVDDEVVRGGLD